MLRCPFCTSEVDESELHGGRCPSCGSILAWSESEIEETGEGPPPAEQPTGLPQTIELPADDLPSTPYSNMFSDAEGSDIDVTVAYTPPGESPVDRIPDADEGDTIPATVPELKLVGDDEPDEGNLITKTITPRDLSVDELEELEENWRGTFSPETTHHATIKTEESLAGRDSALVVQERAVIHIEDERATRSDYQILNIIGEGGVGVVYEARQASIGRQVAVKMLRSESAHQAGQQEKFIAEAVVTGDLDHPNIVPIYDLGKSESGALFYSMKRVQGTPWSDVIGQKSLDENLDILVKVANAIAFAHSRHVVHRDLKPENVMLGDFGEVLVMDWGIALAMPDFHKSDITQSGSLGGTPAYMAPEMATGPVISIGPKADIYLLGGLLFETLTGLTPHTGRDVMSCLRAAARNEIQPSDETGELLEIALHAMATNPEERFADVREFLDAIRQYQSHSESIHLTERAEEDLRMAESDSDYQIFARSMFGFEEALALWSGNSDAKAGLSQAKKRYAQRALDNGDFDLGLSLLDERDPKHVPLRKKLIAAQAERELKQHRLNASKRFGRMVVALLFFVVTGAAIWIWREKGQAETNWELAEQAKTELNSTIGTLNETNETLGETNEKLDEEREEAEKQARRADREANLARREQQRTMAAMKREEFATREKAYDAYHTQIGLAAEKIEDNAFDDAVRLLEMYADSDLKNWEWARLWYQCRQSLANVDTGSPIDAVAFSPGGDRFVTGSQDGVARVYGLPNQGNSVLEQTLEHTPGVAIDAVAWSHDGRYIAAGDESGTVYLWDIENGGRRTLTGHSRPVRSAVFANSDEHRWLLTASEDHSVILWDLETGRPAHPPLRGHSWWVWDADISITADHIRIVSAGQDGKIIVWNVTNEGTGLTIRKWKELVDYHRGPVYAAAFSPDGQTVATGGFDGRVLLWKPDDVVSLDLQARLDGRPEPPPSYQVLKGHSAPVWTVAFSPDPRGTLLASGGDDNTLIVWNARTGTPLRTLRGHGSWVRSVAFAPSQSVADANSPDDRLVLSGSHDRHAKLWSIAGYDEIRVFRGQVLEGHEDAVLHLGFDRGGERIATAGADRVAHVWNLKTGEVTHLRDSATTYEEGHEFLATGAVFFTAGPHRGRYFLTSAMDNTVRLWDVAAGTERTRLTGTGRNATVALSPDQKWIATGSNDNSVLLWRVDELWDALAEPTPQRLDRHEAPVTAAAFSHAENRLVTGDALGNLWLWDVETGQPIRPLGENGAAHSRRVTGLVFLPDGVHVVSGSNDNSVSVWNVETGLEVPSRRMTHPDSISAMALSPDGTQLATVSRPPRTDDDAHDSLLQIWDVNSGQRLHQRPVSGRMVTSIDFAADGNSLYVTADDYRVRRWTPRSNQLQLLWPDLTGGGLIWTVLDTPDGEHVLTVGGKHARMRDPESGRLVMQFGPHAEVSAANFSPDGKWLVTGSWGNSVKIWDIENANAVRRLVAIHDGPVVAASFSPIDANQLLTAGGGSAKLWLKDDQGAWQVQFELIGHKSTLRDAVFSPDGKWVVTTSDDHTARVWNAKTGEAVAVLGGRWGHDGPVLCADVSRDGRWILTGSQDKTARLWTTDPLTGEWFAVSVMAGHPAPVGAVSFSPDGRRALTGSDDRTAKLWDVHRPIRESREPSTLAPVLLASRTTEESERILREYPQAQSPHDEGDQADALVPTRQLVNQLFGKFGIDPPDPGEKDFPIQIQRALTALSEFTSNMDVEQMQASELSQTLHLARRLRRTLLGPDHLTELLTLRGHAAEVTSAQFSPNGRYVATAGRDGTTVIWPAVTLPPVIELTKVELTVTPETEKLPIAESALITDSDSPSFAGGRLIVEQLDAPEAGHLEWPSGGNAEVTVDDAGVVLVRQVGGPDFVSIGTLTRSGTKTQIDFNELATAEALTALIRSVQFVPSTSAKPGSAVQIRFIVTDETGKTSSAKTVTILYPIIEEEDEDDADARLTLRD